MKQQRQSEIVRILDDRGLATVTQLSDRFDVSEMTIRRDLLDLETAGLVRRVHGGATRSLGRAFEPPFRVRLASSHPAKRAIAKAATRHIREGDAIGLDVGSTVIEMVSEFVPIDNLTVVTASLRVANKVSELHALERSIRLIVTGGITRADELSLVGQRAIDTYRDIRLDTAFISVGGLALQGGATEFNLEDADVKRAMIVSSRDVIVLADSNKFHQTGFAHVMDLQRASLIITDDGIDPAIEADLRGAGIPLEIVPVVAADEG